jgi:hypothetical protein
MLAQKLKWANITVMGTGKKLLGLVVLCFFFVGGAAAAERLYSLSELAALDRENAMWRLVQVEDDVDANLQLWKSKGFTEGDVNSLKPRLVEVWDIGLERNFGWLSQDAIERIQKVDQRFTARLRAIRLFKAYGIRAGELRMETASSLTRDWQRAIMRQLDYQEIAEFRLVNSRSAQTITRLGKGLEFTTDELRTLCEWQREFDVQHTRDPRLQGYSHRTWRSEDNLDYWTRVRSLLGDVRFQVYFSRIDAGFDRMNQAIARLDGITPTVVLDLWWIKEKREISNSRVIDRQERDRVARQTYQGAEELLGKARFAVYSQDETARWLRY